MAYVQASTANPLGFRPWQSRLGEYHRAVFYVPTPNDLLSGLGVEFPNYATFIRSRSRPPRPDVPALQPRIYLPPEAAAIAQQRAFGARGAEMSGLGLTLPAEASPRAVAAVAKAHSRGLRRRGFPPQRPISVHPHGLTVRNPNWATMRGLGQMAYTPIPPAGTSSGGQIELPGGVTVQVSQQPPGTLDSITAWLTSNTIISSVPNWVLVGAGILLLARRR